MVIGKGAKLNQGARLPHALFQDQTTYNAACRPQTSGSGQRHQCTWVNLQRNCQLLYDVQADVALAILDLAYVGPFHTSFEGKLFLKACRSRLPASRYRTGRRWHQKDDVLEG